MARAALGLLLAGLFLATGCSTILGPRGDASGPGERAADYLRLSPYARILVELDFVQGSGPEDRAAALLERRLEDVTRKPVEVVRAAGVPAQGAEHRSTREEIARLEERFRGQFSGGETAALYVLYLDGGFEADDGERKTLGAAYRGSSIVMFKGNLRFASRAGPLEVTKPPIEEVEEAVLVHEIGHILGLVNLGTPMVANHEDPEHPGHSRSRRSVMFWAVEVSAIGAVLGQTPPDDFDADDRADLQAARRG